MARFRGSNWKKSRRLGISLSGTGKELEKRPYAPGQHGPNQRKKLSEYGLQLLEKQRLRAYYGVMEKQFRTYVEKALRQKERITGDALVMMLETRLDNLVYRMGFASSIRQARQMVVHGHMLVNGKKVDIPSYAVQVGDEITLREKSQKVEMFKENFESTFLGVVPYIEKKEGLKATLTRMPERDEVPIEIQDSLVVEFYSRLI